MPTVQNDRYSTEQNEIRCVLDQYSGDQLSVRRMLKALPKKLKHTGPTELEILEPQSHKTTGIFFIE